MNKARNNNTLRQLKNQNCPIATAFKIVALYSILTVWTICIYNALITWFLG